MEEEEEKSEAYLNGWHAHRLGNRIGVNPYHITTQYLSNARWISGWCARFSACKHDQSLGLDEVCP